MSRTRLKSSQVLLCHKLFQLRKYAIIPLITFYFDERSRLFFFFFSFLKCMLYRVRRTFISILCILWHQPCLCPTAGSGPCRGTCASQLWVWGTRHWQSSAGCALLTQPCFSISSIRGIPCSQRVGVLLQNFSLGTIRIQRVLSGRFIFCWLQW